MIISDLFHGCYHYLLPPSKGYPAGLSGSTGEVLQFGALTAYEAEKAPAKVTLRGGFLFPAFRCLGAVKARPVGANRPAARSSAQHNSIVRHCGTGACDYSRVPVVPICPAKTRKHAKGDWRWDQWISGWQAQRAYPGRIPPLPRRYPSRSTPVPLHSTSNPGLEVLWRGTGVDREG